MFSAVLGTAACRPGNIVLAYMPGLAPVSASASLVASSSMFAGSTLHQAALATLLATSSVVAEGEVTRTDRVSMVASSTMDAVADLHVIAVAALGGRSFVGGGNPTVTSPFTPYVAPSSNLPVVRSVPQPQPPPHNTIPRQKPLASLSSGLGVNVKRT